jgi:LmbE family N-acetylglucosaminyl deacetylase
MTVTPTPADLFLPATRVMFVLAHQDDELAYAGLVRRAPPDSRFLWVTNGDGLASAAGMGLGEYAEARRLETTLAMSIAGVAADRLRFLGHSEVAIYRSLVRHSREPGAAHEVQRMIRDVAAQVGSEVRAYRPDVVFTLAWQGGHPEHDLVHCMARAAVADRKDDRLFELPEYELAYTVPLRFPPWRRDPVHRIRLTADELLAKRRMFESYPTQADGLRMFRKLMTAYQALNVLRGRPAGWEEYASTEEFGPVPRDRDYGRSPHGLDLLDYIGDDCEGIPIRFSTMVGPLATVIVGG